jgi:hypothetical protein
MALKGNSTSISANTTLVTMPATLEGAVHGLQIGNTTSNNINVEFKFADSSNSSETTFLIAPVSANSTFTFQKPINLNSLDAIIASSTATGLVGITSTFEDSTVNLGVLSTAGVYTSATTYGFGDLVSDGAGNTLISTFAGNVNRGIDNASAFQTFASKGDAGSGFDGSGNASASGQLNIGTVNSTSLISDTDGNLRDVPKSRTIADTTVSAAQTDTGNFIFLTSSDQTVVIPTASGTFDTGDIFSVVCAGASATISSNITSMFKVGEAASTATITLGANKIASVLFVSSQHAYITGT